MTYRNSETGDTIGNKTAYHLVKRWGTVEMDSEADDEITRFVIDRDGAREEWVLIDEDG